MPKTSKKGYTAVYSINAKTLNEFVEKNGNKNPEELWFEFETWLHSKYVKTLSERKNSNA